MSQFCIVDENDCIDLAKGMGMRLVPENYTCVPFETFLENPDDAFVSNVVILGFSLLLIVVAMSRLCCKSTKQRIQ